MLLPLAAIGAGSVSAICFFGPSFNSLLLCSEAVSELVPANSINKFAVRISISALA